MDSYCQSQWLLLCLPSCGYTTVSDLRATASSESPHPPWLLTLVLFLPLLWLFHLNLYGLLVFLSFPYLSSLFIFYQNNLSPLNHDFQPPSPMDNFCLSATWTTLLASRFSCKHNVCLFSFLPGIHWKSGSHPRPSQIPLLSSV